MALFEGLLTITIVHLLAAASPGPDLIMVTQTSLTRGKAAGILCSLGIALGLAVHILYSSLGLAALVSQSAHYLSAIKCLAALYLIYLGIRGLRSKAHDSPNNNTQDAGGTSPLTIVSHGFVCNVLNPKAPLYFLAVFSLVLSPSMPIHQIFIYGSWMMILQFLWFSSVATVLSQPLIRSRFQKTAHWIDRLFGALMLGLGLRLLLGKSN